MKRKYYKDNQFCCCNPKPKPSRDSRSAKIRNFTGAEESSLIHHEDNVNFFGFFVTTEATVLSILTHFGLMDILSQVNPAN